MGDAVRVAYTKFDGSLHYHQTMTRLGADEHGSWLGAPPGTIMRKGADGPPITIPQPHVLLVPGSGWWTAVFNGEPARLEIYCDITTPATWPDPHTVTMIDLDLDVGRIRADGRVERYDDDEFAEHQIRYGYPAEVVAQASAAADWLMAAVSAAAEPFGGAHRRWLARVAPAGPPGATAARHS
ncbi:DUF402 domain-containing protein [Plantactinospora siamensis]|uniref:DUF402 domain-containing protein n=1 Tax=Plantactinospora siamensis TaxID=555372 RepID=A0ABV6NPH2_9ACTN